MNQRAKPSGPFALYWAAYGGTRALLKSWYFRIAFLLSLLSFPTWVTDGWWETVISVVPSLMGFSLAAFAMLLAFANEKFVKKVLSKPIEVGRETRRPSAYAAATAAFFHFVLFQTLALTVALLCKTWYVPIWPPMRSYLEQMNAVEAFVTFSRAAWFLGYLLFIYSIAVGLAATSRIYTLSRWYTTYLNIEETDEDLGSKKEDP